MLYKLYIQRFKEDITIDYQILYDMVEMYKKYDIMVLGHWINRNNRNETVIITIYKDEAQYKQFVEMIKHDPEYQKREEYLENNRESLTIYDLELNPYPNLHPNKKEMSEYVDDVKSMVDRFTT